MINLDNNDVTKQMQIAQKRFSVISPYLLDVFKAEKIVNIEVTQRTTTADTPLAALDVHAGIDAYILRGGQLFGIALRMCGGSFKTFTVRKARLTSGVKTEYEKKLNAPDGALLPYYTVQAYFDDNNKLYSIGICYTRDLMQYIHTYERDKQRVTVLSTQDNGGTVEFYVVDWFLYAQWAGQRGFRMLPAAKKNKL